MVNQARIKGISLDCISVGAVFQVRCEYLIRLAIAGLIRRWTLICDMGNSERDIRSIKDMSKLYNSLPSLLSTDNAICLRL